MTVETERTEGMKALTLHRPWSFAVAHLGKDVENRGWRTNDRGELAIHAGKTWDWISAEMIERISGHEFVPWEDDRHPDAWRGIVAVANLVDCHEVHQPAVLGGTQTTFRLCCDSSWAQTERRTFHWVLADVRPLDEPVPCKGRQGLWTLPDDVERKVRERLEDTEDVG